MNSQPPKCNITSRVAILRLSETQQVTGKIFGITHGFFYFDAFPGGHKKSPDRSPGSVGRVGGCWLEHIGERSGDGLSSGLIGRNSIDRRGSDALVAESLLDDCEVDVRFDH